MKDVAKRGPLTALNASKCVCGRGSAPYLAGGAYSAPPDPLARFRGGRGGREIDNEREGRRKGRDGKRERRREEMGKERTGR